MKKVLCFFFIVLCFIFVQSSEISAAGRFHFGLTVEERNHRLMIVAIDRRSKSFESGLRRGDFILGINGRRINDIRDLKRILSRLGNKSLFYISRKGYKKEILIQFKEDFIYDAGRGNYNIGLSVEEIKEGLFIKEVNPASVAFEGGLNSGDIIVGANGYRVRKVQHLKLVLDQYTEGELLLYIKRKGRKFKTRLTMTAMKPKSREISERSAPSSRPVVKKKTKEKRKSTGEQKSGKTDYDKLLEKFATDS
ncbi:PDZ domain-containing protein [Candidatus Riflebacteria bacterium]